MEFPVQKFMDTDGSIVGIAVASCFLVGRNFNYDTVVDSTISADSPKELVQKLHTMISTQITNLSQILSDLSYFLL